MGLRHSLIGLGISLSATLAASGCVVDGDFDPLGSDVALSGTWEIKQPGEEAQPANAETCAAAGIAGVQLVVFEEGGEDPHLSDRLRFPCEQGRFDTRDMAPEKILRHDRYETQWRGFAEDGTMVAEGPRLLLDVSDPTLDHAMVSTPVFTIPNLEVTMNWEVGPGAGYSDCEGSMVDDMTWSLRDASDAELASGEHMCMDVLELGVDAGTYSLVITGDNEKDVWGATCTGLEVTDPSTTTTFDCDVPVDTGSTPTETLEMQLRWEDPASAGSFTDCATAMVDEMSWSLQEPEGGATVASNTESCAEVLTVPDVEHGTYELAIDGVGSSNTWRLTCTMIVVDEEITPFSCRVELE